ncbi:uncharacterized protein LOC144332053 [Macaca mulatta]
MATAGSRSLTAGKRGPEPGYRLGLRAAQGESLRPPAPASLPVGDPKPAAKSASSFPRRPRDRKCLGPGRGRTRVASSAPSLESAPVPALLPRPSPWQLLAFGAWAASQEVRTILPGTVLDLGGTMKIRFKIKVVPALWCFYGGESDRVSFC